MEEVSTGKNWKSFMDGFLIAMICNTFSWGLATYGLIDGSALKVVVPVVTALCLFSGVVIPMPRWLRLIVGFLMLAVLLAFIAFLLFII